ncbi:NTPase KAP family P-loop domain-containing protein 1 [Lampris incognitus]|uniref:NTPase KAP family P-loop domain-containing protein 1 n=1 Tax=Lampris incognitus TaxID=2546036 RepID=UPI0024B53BD1|nr:NTPase KAP family P-loop domain-containing protein 1 [Lampris incognitus]
MTERIIRSTSCLLPSDDVHAYALAKTLVKVASPVTVGLYSACENRINMILKQMEVYMEREALRMEQEYNGRSRPRPVKLSLTGLLALIGRLLFYKPIWTEESQQHHNIRFIYVHFSAWHFSGSDLLWAGLTIRLFQAMQVNFGKLPIGLYRMAQYDEDDEVVEKTVEDGPNEWRSKKLCCCPLWLVCLATLLTALIIMVLLVILGFPKENVDTGESEGGDEMSNSKVGVLEGVAIAALGVPAAGAVRFIFLMGKNLIFTQDLNIRRGMDNEQVSNKLGFMNEVRKEMWLLSNFIHFMELFERRRIRVVLKITNLDRCSPRKIVAVLDAMNILLSEVDSPFISLLAVNPEVVVQKVNFADGWFSKEDRAYAFLNRIVTLAFTVPPLCDASKCKVFHSLTCPEFAKDLQIKTDEQSSKPAYPLDDFSVANAEINESLNPLIDTTTAAWEPSEEEVENLISSAFKSILSSHNGNLTSYILDDSISMRRVINSIRVTVIIMTTFKVQLPPPEHIAAWVILANHWPCRLSWIFQCLEDDQQRAEIDATNVAATDKSKTLWEIFRESRAELYMMREQIDDLLENDSDPEMFERFLKVDFQFTVEDLERFKLATVNLDDSIKNELGKIRGTSRLKDSVWMRKLASLPIRVVVNMSEEDVCKELKRLNFPDKYANVVRSNDLSGQALVFGDVDDLKLLFQMTAGEWTTFRLHFLGFYSYLRPQYKAVQRPTNHLQNQLPRSSHLVPHHHSSARSLAFQ